MKTRWKKQEGKEEKVSGRKREEEKGREREDHISGFSFYRMVLKLKT